MKVKDVIAKQEEYRQIQQAKEELQLFMKHIDVFYWASEHKAFRNNETTSRLFETEISDAIIACRDKLKKQLNEMEV